MSAANKGLNKWVFYEGIKNYFQENFKNKKGQRENMEPSCIFKTFALII